MKWFLGILLVVCVCVVTNACEHSILVKVSPTVPLGPPEQQRVKFDDGTTGWLRAMPIKWGDGFRLVDCDGNIIQTCNQDELHKQLKGEQ